MAFNVRTVDLAKLNSLTKYPSIVTYHTLDPKNGGLLEEATAFAGTVIGTEKVDGTNSRVICLPDSCYLLGSREELLYGKGDLIGNPALGIVDALKATADRLCDCREEITVYYFEVFGGKVTANSKQYTGEHLVSFRLFAINDDELPRGIPETLVFLRTACRSRSVVWTTPAAASLKALCCARPIVRLSPRRVSRITNAR